jgi:hypothetical protein
MRKSTKAGHLVNANPWSNLVAGQGNQGCHLSHLALGQEEKEQEKEAHQMERYQT